MGVELPKNYDRQQIKRWNEITKLLRTVDEQNQALDRELSRTSQLLIAYCQKIEAHETDKASDLKLMGWAKRVPTAFPQAINVLSKLNTLLESAIPTNEPHSPGGVHDDV